MVNNIFQKLVARIGKKNLFSIFVTIFLFIFLLLIICSLLFSINYLGLLKTDNNTQSQNINTNNSSFDENNKDKENKNLKDFYSEKVIDSSSDLINLIEKLKPAIVTVMVTKQASNNSFWFDLIPNTGVGTGFFISEDGLLITNEHVVCGASSNNIKIITVNNKIYDVENIAIDPAQDVAILKVNTNNEKVPFLKFANPDTKVKVGQEVIAIGNPFGDNPASVTKGIISGINRNITARGFCGSTTTIKEYEGVIQTDAAINSGNSGGPLLNMLGEVIGVNSATLEGANNISYTVPHDTVLKVIQRYLQNNGKIISPFLGVSHRMINSSRNVLDDNGVMGALVLNVQPGSPADKAGIKPNDIIVRLGDKDIKFSLVATLNKYFEPNQDTVIRVYRFNENTDTGSYINLNIKIGSRTYENQ